MWEQDGPSPDGAAALDGQPQRRGSHEREIDRSLRGVLHLEVLDVRLECPGVCTWSLASRTPGQQLTYRAGQHVNLLLPAEDRTVMRSYSASSCPVSDPYLSLTVKRSREGGSASWLFENGQVGTTLVSAGVGGRLTLDTSTRAVRLYAAGMGITPLFSLCKSALSTTTQTVMLHYTCPSAESAVFAGQLESLKRRHPGRFDVSYHFSQTVGRPRPEDLEPYVVRAPGAAHYVCGPEGYTAMVRKTLHSNGAPCTQVKAESFPG